MAKHAYKRLYSIRECYHLLDELMKSIKHLRKDKKKKLVSDAFKERLMLAVTEVNGCEMCSYVHTGSALKAGVSEEEINAVLSGDLNKAPKEESIALFFAQHYAETKSNPDKESWNRVISTYGEEKAKVILGHIRVIMVGNAYVAVYSAFKSRLSGKPVEKSTLAYELGIFIGSLLFAPVLLVKSLGRILFGRDDTKRVV